MKKFNNIKGQIGEKIAVNYLKNKGYKIVKTNYKNAIGEIDVIAYFDKILVFIEVKYRKNNVFGLPREAVNKQKQLKIRNCASVYINQNRLFDRVVRFDVIEILDDKVQHIEGGF